MKALQRLACGCAAWLALAAAPAQAVRVVVAGHLRGEATGEHWRGLPELVRAIQREQPAAVVLTGDLIWGDYRSPRPQRAALEADWESLDAALAPIGAPIYRVPGNHDANDPVSRALFDERYGPLPRAVTLPGVQLLLLDSTESDDALPAPVPRRHIRTEALSAANLAFLRAHLEPGQAPPASLVFLHHVLWWEPDAPWWKDVHPLLVAGNVRAVFAGDYGPLAFSYERRDGIDYLQSAVAGPASLDMLRQVESVRLLNYQLDTFLVVDVEDGVASVEVKAVDALGSGRFEPDLHRAMYVPWPRSVRERIEEVLGGPTRRALLAAAALAIFSAGALAGAWLARRRR